MSFLLYIILEVLILYFIDKICIFQLSYMQNMHFYIVGYHLLVQLGVYCIGTQVFNSKQLCHCERSEAISPEDLLIRCQHNGIASLRSQWQLTKNFYPNALFRRIRSFRSSHAVFYWQNVHISTLLYRRYLLWRGRWKCDRNTND